MNLSFLCRAILASVFCVALLCATAAAAKRAAAKPSRSVAIPRSKDAKKKNSPLQHGMFGRLFRETKMFFSSGLEAITLQLTRPSDTATPMEVLGELVDCLNAEYENPEVVISVLAKLSRKLHEPSVYSKLKALLSVHRLIQKVDEPVRNAVLQTVSSLREVFDKKCGDNFFSLSFVEDSSATAGSVAEVQAADFARLYAPYVLSCVEARGRKSRQAVSQSHCELLLSLFDTSEEIEAIYRESERSPVLKECFECIRHDRQWIFKQLQRSLDDDGGLDGQTEEDVRQLLIKNGIIAAPEKKPEADAKSSEGKSSQVKLPEGKSSQVKLPEVKQTLSKERIEEASPSTAAIAPLNNQKNQTASKVEPKEYTLEKGKDHSKKEDEHIIDGPQRESVSATGLAPKKKAIVPTAPVIVPAKGEVLKGAGTGKTRATSKVKKSKKSGATVPVSKKEGLGMKKSPPKE